MKTIKVKIEYESKLLRYFFPRWVSGVTIGTNIFYRNKKEDVSARTQNHELIHVCQYQDQGISSFLWNYLWEQRNVSYRDKPAEVEAYANDTDFAYIAKRWPNYKIIIDK
jgi:hypothetical protein